MACRQGGGGGLNMRARGWSMIELKSASDAEVT